MENYRFINFRNLISLSYVHILAGTEIPKKFIDFGTPGYHFAWLKERGQFRHRIFWYSNTNENKIIIKKKVSFYNLSFQEEMRFRLLPREVDMPQYSILIRFQKEQMNIVKNEYKYIWI